MATDAALVLKLEARVRDFEKQLDRAAKKVDSTAKGIEGRFAKINPRGFTALRSQADALVPVLGRVGLALAGIATVSNATKALDAFTRIQNSLKVTGLAGDQLRAVYDELYASAQRQGAPLETLATLYSRVAGAQTELKTSSSEILTFTEGVATALRVSGQSAEQASGALLQLGQALAGGKVQAEEYNSLLDGARPLLQAVANGLTEAGGSVAKLTALVKDGQVSSEAFYRAGLAGFAELSRQASTSSATVGQATERVSNAFINLVGKIDEVGNVSSNVTSIILGLAAAIDKVTAAIPGYLAGLRAASDPSITVKGGFAGDITDENQWKKVLGVEKIEDANKSAEQLLRQGLEKRAELIRKSLESNGTTSLVQQPRRPITPTPIRTVSLSDFPVPEAGGGGGGRKGRGGGGSRAVKEDEFQREMDQYRKRREAIELEAATLGKSTFEIEKAKAVQDLLNAAKDAHIPISESVRAAVDQEAEGYAKAAANLEELRNKQEQINQFSEEIGSALSGAFVDAIVNGEKLSDVLENLLKQLATMAINSAFQQIFSAPAGGGQSLFGSLLAGILHDGGIAGGGGRRRAVSPAAFVGAPRYHSGGIAGIKPGEVPAILQRGEMVIPKDAVRGMGAGGGGGGSVNVTVAPVFQSGSTAADAARALPEIRRVAVAAVKEAMIRRDF